MTKKQYHRNRKSKTIQFVPGQDDDLIQWLATLPPTHGQRMIKMALRAYLQQDEAQAQQIARIEQHLAALENGLQQMPEWLDSRFAVVQQTMRSMSIVAGTSALSQTESTFRMSAETKAKRQANFAKMKW